MPHQYESDILNAALESGEATTPAADPNNPVTLYEREAALALEAAAIAHATVEDHLVTPADAIFSEIDALHKVRVAKTKSDMSGLLKVRPFSQQ